jgi:hypothetical protein
MAKKSKINRKAWFYKTRGSYLPANKYGWLTYIPFIGYLVFSFIVGLKDINIVWVATLFILANWLASAAMMTLLAIHKS